VRGKRLHIAEVGHADRLGRRPLVDQIEIAFAGFVVDLGQRQITLTVDHRVLEGAVAAAFLRDLTQLLEEPLRIVL
jgi:pyruvate/2-oxoglutarate dehydrogenase complex dihydrolipoamide acyltransferase (E2) component